MTLKNLIRALREQGPFKRFLKNFIYSKNGWGLFYKGSHISKRSDKPKIGYKTKTSAQKAAEAMSKKNKIHFSHYKCIYCDDYHIGVNRHNRNRR